MKNINKILITIAIIAIFIITGFVTGEIQAIYNRTVGVDVSNSETDMFHASKGYVDGMTQNLAKYKLELSKTTDTTARNAITTYINQEFANYDETRIQNADLKQFLIDVRNGNIK